MKKKCRNLNLEFKLKNEEYNRKKKLMETEQKLKDLEWETQLISKQIKETELKMTLLTYKKNERFK